MDSAANIKKWIATSVRALANEPSAYYRGGSLYIDSKPYTISSPHLQLLSEEEQYSNLRGIADGIALRLSLSDEKIFDQYCPEDIVGKLVYELLEQIRIEAQPDMLPGVKANLKKRFLVWADQTNGNGLTETELGLMMFTITTVVWSRLNSYELPEVVQDNIESTRMGLASQLGNNLRRLRMHRFDQEEFAKVSLSVVDIILDSFSPDDDEEGNSAQTEAEIKKSLNLLFFPSDLGQEVGMMTSLEHYAALNPSETLREYTVFTKEFDQEDRVSDLVRQAQLEKFRESLDELIKKNAISYVRIAHHAKKLFSYRQSNAWLFAQEVGSIDPKQLPHMIADPDYYYLYRQQMVLPEEDNVISILIDNSGSMSNHIPTLAVIIDLLVRGFEVAKIKTEVLGYTTAKWNGGRAFKQWKSAGSPKNPGRLNDLNHYIYKSAKEKWQHSRNALAGMFKTDLFRESLDGEGVLWAAKRLRNSPGSRKTLLVISDGSPMDTSTEKANDQPILDSHLLNVVSDLEQQGDINLCALGVGLDMSAYFSQSYAVPVDHPLNMKVIADIIDLLAEKKHLN
jgi:cobaltochelatase CobT